MQQQLPPGVTDYCNQVCGGGQCGSGIVCQYGIDHTTHMPPVTTIEPPIEARLRLVLDVTYTLNGASTEDMRSRLLRIVENAIENGLLTGDSPAEVEDYSTDAKVFPEVSEESLTAFFEDRIENGLLGADDIAGRLAKYGLMDPASFSAEMSERMEEIAFEAEGV